SAKPSARRLQQQFTPADLLATTGGATPHMAAGLFQHCALAQARWECADVRIRACGHGRCTVKCRGNRWEEVNEMNTRTRDTDVGVAISTGHHLHLGLDSPLSQSSPPSSGRRPVSLPAGAVQLRSFSYLVHSGINILIHGFQNPEQQDWD